MKFVMKRSLSLFLVLFLSLSLFYQSPILANASSIYKWITKREDVDGYDYTQSSKLAEKLNSIFDGNANIYRDKARTNLVNTKIGSYSVPNNGVTLYTGPVTGGNSGTSCWIYANGVYYTLFNEVTGNGDAGKNSVKLTAASGNKATYANFKAWGVRDGVGALIRADGHSMIVLDYDETQLTILDGNGDGNGLISLRVRSWDKVNFTVTYIIQPKEDYYKKLYPICETCNYEYCYCTVCGQASDVLSDYLAQCTGKTDTSIRVKTVKSGTVKTLPCSAGTNSVSETVESFTAGKTYKVSKIVRNPEGNLWYGIILDGKERYIYGGHAEFGYANGVNISNVVYPTSIVKGNSFNIDADLSSDNYIYSVTAQVYSGSGVTSGTPVISSSKTSINSHTFDVKGSDVNKKLSFGTLPVGTYTYVLKYKYDYYYCDNNSIIKKRSDEVFCVSKTFTVTAASSSHIHSYKATVIKPTCTVGGYTLYKCSCGASYENDWTTNYGHNPGSAATCTTAQTCTRCGTVIKAATGHCYTATVTKPTCTEKGYTTYTCKCGYSYKDSYVAATGHSYTATVTKPTCTEKGYTTYICKCGASYKCDYVGVSGHNYKKTVVAPKCNSEGYTHYECTRCSKEYYSDYTAMLAHKWDKGTVIKEPTVKKTGEIKYVCTVCKISKIEELERLDYMLGDVDMSGSITAADARQALRCSVGLEKISSGSIKFYACDADLDGKISSSDARIILRASVGLEKL